MSKTTLYVPKGATITQSNAMGSIITYNGTRPWTQLNTNARFQYDHFNYLLRLEMPCPKVAPGVKLYLDNELVQAYPMTQGNITTCIIKEIANVINHE